MAHYFGWRFCALSLCLLPMGQASALGLMQAYNEAQQNDPTYRAAIYDNQAGQEYKVLGRVHLLPTLSASYSNRANRASITRPGFAGRLSTTQHNYNSTTKVLQLRQPLFNLASLASYYQGVAQTDYSDAKFSAQRQELIIRLVSAYLNAKFSEDNLSLAIAQGKTYAEQQLVNERKFENGEGTKTDMLETQARAELSEAEVLEAKDNLADSRNALAALVGHEIHTMDSLRAGFSMHAVRSLAQWKAIALSHNPNILAQNLAVEAAQQDINKNRAAHAPTLDLVASISDNQSQAIYTLNQKIKSTSVGIQLNIPLYSGGYTSALTSQSRSKHQKALAELESTKNKVLIDLRKNYNLVLSSALRINALVKTLSSARLLVVATQKSVLGGLRTNLDVLNARGREFTAKRDLARARYGYLQYYLQLRQAAGVVGEEDLKKIAAYFVASSK